MTQTTQRDSNFELFRLVAMMLVMLVHANYASIGDVAQSELLATPLSAIVRVVCEQLCIVSVNLFVLLSGWFGIRPTLKKFASFIFQVLFIGLSVTQICRLSGVEVPSRMFSDMLYFGASYWFVPAYIILFWLAPVLNSFAEHASKRDFVSTLVAFYLLQSLFGWLTYDYGHFHQGYSALSFVGLYLLARYVRLHAEKLRAMAWWKHLLGYLLFTAIPAALSLAGLYFANKSYGATSYASLLVVGASVSLLLMFSKFHFQSKAINWLSASAFAIYLVHQAPGAMQLYYQLFDHSFDTMSGWLFIPFVFATTLAIALASILFDKVRMVVWSGVLRLAEMVKPQR